MKKLLCDELCGGDVAKSNIQTLFLGLEGKISVPTSFILRNCPMLPKQSSRFMACSVAKCGRCDGSSQHLGQAEDEHGPACVKITICDPCSEAGQLAQLGAVFAGSSPVSETDIARE